MRQFKNFDELPLILRAEDMANVLGISRSLAYTLLHREGFPTLHLGRRLLAPRDKFIQWINQNTI